MTLLYRLAYLARSPPSRTRHATRIEPHAFTIMQRPHCHVYQTMWAVTFSVSSCSDSGRGYHARGVWCSVRTAEYAAAIEVKRMR